MMPNNPANSIVPSAKSRASSILCGRWLSCFGAMGLLGLILMMPVSRPAMAQDSGQNAGNPEVSKAQKQATNYSDIRYQSGNRRDPFLNPMLLAEKAKNQNEEVARGLPPPGIAGTYIAQLKLEGLSFRDDRRIAIVRGADKRAYFLEEGDKLFDGYVKNIEPDFITLVRET
jgi:hypothetical protein